MNQQDLTLILYCQSVPSRSNLQAYRAMAARLQLILVSASPSNVNGLPEEIAVIHFDEDTGKTAALNKAVRRSEGSAILWLEDGETIPEIPADIPDRTYFRARVFNTSVQGPVANCQVRLFPNPKRSEPLFDGYEIPDIQKAAGEQKWNQSDQILSIERETPLITTDIIKKESGEEGDAPAFMQPYWRAMAAAEKGDFNSSIAGFKQILQKDKMLFRWHKLAAINSLANAYMEVQRAEEAKATAEKSLGICTRQWAPYLTLHQYYNLKGKWDLAYQSLRQYRDVAQYPSSANWDPFLPDAQAAFLMAEIASGYGEHKQAYRHYEEFYAGNNGNTSRPVLEKLFIYAIELGDEKKAVTYFQALFGSNPTITNVQDKKIGLLEALTMFTDNEWYTFPSTVYRQLVEDHPDDETVRNGCIRTLIKNNEVEKAQALLSL